MLAIGSAYAQPAVAIPQVSASIHGAVTDASGAVVAGAVVTLGGAATIVKRTTVTDAAGSFHFATIEPGNYSIVIAADSFSPWTATDVVVHAGENPPLLSAVLQVAPASSKVDVTLPQKELAAEQLKVEEKQRLIGIFPHFFVSYDPNAAPLTASQKFQLGWKSIVDPIAFLSTGAGAAISQARNSDNQFGQGTEGYAKRFGARYADRVSGVIIGHVVTQAVFRQDPRYFYKGTGSIRSRVLYAFATAFVCKGDNGHWQPDYSDVVGGVAAGEISTLYYPASSRTGLRIFHGVLLDFGGRAGHHLMEEFVLRKLTTHVPKTAALPPAPTLREGTPIPLISVDELGSKTAADAGPIAFVLASDIQVGGTTVAQAGSKAWGLVSYASGPSGDVGATHVSLDRVRLKLGSAEVPLRSTQARGGAGALQYRRLDDSGRIAIVLYVAESTAILTE
jgi:hypothetical protein